MKSYERASIYLDPSYQPSFFYPLLKPLCVIYDRVFVWSPVRVHLEQYGFTPGDFVTACRKTAFGPPAIAPAARPAWFDAASRRNHPDRNARQFDGRFESRVGNAAAAGNWILPPDYQAGYYAVDELVENPPGEFATRAAAARAGLP